MDDPVSALDANVKKRIFSKVFKGDMNDKTRVLVTHAIDFLEHVDRIIIMEEGKIKNFGSWEDLKQTDELQHIISIAKKTQCDDGDDVGGAID
jgi:ATP-binding cassette subfamily C (CFTR/MRP) protein 1